MTAHAPTDHRLDIGGLRAIAVLLVLLAHTVGLPAGGYLGVDVFFVLSGFLITGIMLREHARTGRISFAEFYRRRARRILPAAVLVVAATVGVAQVLFLANRAHDVRVDALWSTFFLANVHFSAQGTDYFDATGAVSPFQHYWSLGVEEQFYVVWPLLVVGGLALGRRTGSRPLLPLTVMAALVTVGTFAWAVHRTATAPTDAYFSTATRAWELGVGTLIAVGAGWIGSRPGRWWRHALAWGGLAALGLGAFWLTPASPVPGPGAALPVLGTAAVVVAGTGARAPRLLGILSNPVAQYVGLVSFSLYLWHWPVVVFLNAVMAPGRTAQLVAIVVSAALAVLSYHLVEDPVRRSTWLEPRVRRAAAGPRPALVARPAAVTCVASLTVLAGVASGYAVLRTPAPAGPPPGAVAAAPLGAVPATGAEPVAAEPTGAAAELAQQVTAAVGAAQWPDLSPAIDSLGEDDLAAPWATDECLDVRDDDDVERCRYGAADGAQVAVVLGDSVATSYVPGIADALGAAGFAVQPLTLQACPAADVAVDDFQGEPWAPCGPHREWMTAKLAELRPALVVVAAAEDSVARLSSGATGAAAYDEWTAGLTRTLTTLEGLAPDVVVLAPPPSGEHPATCATARSGPGECLSAVHDTWWQVRRADQAAVEAAGGAAAGIRYVDSLRWFCTDQGYCPVFVGSTPVRVDPNHLTDAYSHALAPVLRDALLPPADGAPADEQAVTAGDA